MQLERERKLLELVQLHEKNEEREKELEDTKKQASAHLTALEKQQMLIKDLEHEFHLLKLVMEAHKDEMGWDGIFGYLTSHEAYCLCVGNRAGHNLHTRG